MSESITGHLQLIRTHLNGKAELIAVSKGQPSEKILEALEAGQMLFGENRVQEAIEKWPVLKSRYPHAQLHLIGPLQTNKIKDALAVFDAIHTLDRPKLVDSLAKAIRKGSRNIPCFVQVNTGKEPQKAGVFPENTGNLIYHARAAGLMVKGLMCIPPVDDDPTAHFSLLQSLAQVHHLPWLSMGMSGDYEKAIACGATHVRIGTAIFGERF